jgi:CheY-like chemotaxis protein
MTQDDGDILPVTILVVEDNDENRELLARRLGRRFAVIAAADGCAAIQLAEQQHPDLILMDMSLPGLDGWEATAQLKAAETTANIPVIALTAHAMRGEEDRAREAGCDDFDVKPIDFPRLLSKILALLATPEATY